MLSKTLSLSCPSQAEPDYAGRKQSQKSMGGGVVTWGKHIVTFWNSTQGAVALSLGEAGCYGMVKGGYATSGLKALWGHVGVDANVVLKNDDGAAVAIASRRGLGEVMYSEVCRLWLQEQVRKGGIRVARVTSEERVAEASIQPACRKVLLIRTEHSGRGPCQGRRELAPAQASRL